MKIFTLCSPFFFPVAQKNGYEFLFRFSFSYGILETDYDPFWFFVFSLGH